MKILYRYLGKEIMLASIAVTLILLFIFLCNQLIHYLTYITRGQLSSAVLLKLLLLQMPILLGLLLPLGFFIAILLAYGRLYNDSEMTIIFATGFSKIRLMRFTLGVAIGVALLAAILVFFLNPYLAKQRDILLTQAATESIAQKIFPGQFQSTNNGNRVYYVENISRDRQEMKNVFFAQKLGENSAKKKETSRWVVLFAKRGHQQIKDGNSYIVMTDGYRYQGQAGEKNYQVVKYDSYGLRLQAPTSDHQEDDVETMPTLMLLKKSFGNAKNAAELQWRISIPLAVLLLGLLALPLSSIKPRQGRFAQMFPALLIAILYVNMLFVSRNWVADKKVPAVVGIWWVHLLLLLLAVVLMARWFGWRAFKTK